MKELITKALPTCRKIAVQIPSIPELYDCNRLAIRECAVSRGVGSINQVNTPSECVVVFKRGVYDIEIPDFVDPETESDHTQDAGKEEHEWVFSSTHHQ